MLLTSLAGAAVPLGGFLGLLELKYFEALGEEFSKFVVAIGGGALLSAICFVLIPKGVEKLSTFNLTFLFLMGGVSFLLLDIYLKKKDSPVSNWVAMMSDFLPEATSVGAVVVTQKSEALFIAVLIGCQNLPEGFSSYKEMKEKGWDDRKIFGFFFASIAFGVAAAVGGCFVLVGREDLLAGLMTFAGGGILYLIFEDIAPQIKLKRAYLPALGTLIGFSVGLVGHALSN